MSWWETYFDEQFLDLYEPFLPEEETRREAGAVLEALGLPRASRILDLGCGWGRHAIELARAGMRVTGLDLSQPLLETARRRAAEAGVEVEWVRADMRKLPYDADFDAVVSLFSSLGYFPTERAELGVLRGVRRALKPGGALLVETMHRDQVAREFAERDWWVGPRGEHVWVEREFDAVAGVSREWLRWRDPEGMGEKYHEIRVRSATEWHQLLGRAGLRQCEWFGDWELSPFTHESEGLIILARAL
jgi:cyclopropane fatty-acyl-phospholipid synthase-like methyltransferase